MFDPTEAAYSAHGMLPVGRRACDDAVRPSHARAQAAVQKLERFNAETLIAAYDRPESPQMSPQ